MTDATTLALAVVAVPAVVTGWFALRNARLTAAAATARDAAAQAAKDAAEEARVVREERDALRLAASHAVAEKAKAEAADASGRHAVEVEDIKGSVAMSAAVMQSMNLMRVEQRDERVRCDEKIAAVESRFTATLTAERLACDLKLSQMEGAVSLLQNTVGTVGMDAAAAAATITTLKAAHAREIEGLRSALEQALAELRRRTSGEHAAVPGPPPHTATITGPGTPATKDPPR